MLRTLSVSEFLDETASNSPAPGGGSVAAFAAASALALLSMVCRLTIGKKKYADVQDEMAAALNQVEELRSRCMVLIDEDTTAFQEVMKALALPHRTEEEQNRRESNVQEATKSAVLVPLHVMEICSNAADTLIIIAQKGNRNSRSDAGVAALMLHGGCEGAYLNVKINLESLHDEKFIRECRLTADSYRARVADAVRVVHQFLETDGMNS
jgi:formiminotetrahydrofolate cyclodeaminase